MKTGSRFAHILEKRFRKIYLCLLMSLNWRQIKRYDMPHFRCSFTFINIKLFIRYQLLSVGISSDNHNGDQELNSEIFRDLQMSVPLYGAHSIHELNFHPL